MLRRVSVLVGAAALWLGGPLEAAGLEQAVRRALAGEDFDALETVISEAHQDALAARDFSELRAMYSTLFVTANAKRFALTGDWLAAYPASPYAATALAWQHYQRAFLERGDRYINLTAPEAQAGFRSELQAAMTATQVALDNSRDFLPAVDAAVRLLGNSSNQGPVDELIEIELDIAPDRFAIKLGLSALRRSWGGSILDTIALCSDLADRVPGYDTELCLVEAAFDNRVEGSMREAALEILDRHDEPFLDGARLEAYLTDWKYRPEAADEAQRIHRESLGPNIVVSTYNHNLERIMSTFAPPFYDIEARDALFETVEKRLADSPQNYNLHAAWIETQLERHRVHDPSADLEGAEAMWPEMLTFGSHQPETWDIGLRLERARHGRLDFDHQAPFHTNKILSLNYESFTVRAYLSELFAGWRLATGEWTASEEIDRAALAEAVTCRMFRAARIFDAICAADPGDPGCNVGGAGADMPARIRKLMREADTCDWERTAPIEALVYEPVPAEYFTEGRD